MRLKAHGTSPVILPFAYEAVSTAYYQPTGTFPGEYSSLFDSFGLRAVSRFNVVSVYHNPPLRKQVHFQSEFAELFIRYQPGRFVFLCLACG